MIDALSAIITLTLIIILYFLLNKPQKKSKYYVEYYSTSKRYYPKYKEYYLRKNYNTGIYTLENNIIFGHCKYTELQAKEMLLEFKEQHIKKNLKIINYENDNVNIANNM